MKNKKTQVTIFLIFAIIILLIGTIYVYQKTKLAEEKAEKGISLEEEIPTEFQPIKSFVENCLIDIAVSGLKKIGEQGGYIDYQKYGLMASNDPTSSDMVRFSPTSSLAVPYWHYLSSENACRENCQFKYGRPNLYRAQGDPSIEKQLDEYVESNINVCLNGFEVFKEQGFNVISLAPPKAITNVAETDVIFQLDYPIRAEKESSKEMSQFLVRIPVNLKRIYEQATLITNLEAEYKFIERDALNLIFGFSGIDKNKLPPFSDSDFEVGDGIRWSKNEVKSKVQEMLTTYIQFLQVLGSANYMPYNFPSGSTENALYNTGMLIPTNESSKDISIFFNYLDFWPIYFDLNCNGDVCKPESASVNFLSLFGIQRYEFYYDLSFPVMVELIDHAALNKRSYRFRFFLEANIRNNEPMKYSFYQLDIQEPGQSLLCDENVRNSGFISINAKDSINNDLIDEADVLFSCTDQTCSIGKTKDGTINDKFPICLGGFVTLMKEGYIGKSILISTSLDKTGSKELLLDPIKTFSFDLRKLSAKKENNWSLVGNTELIQDNESAIISVQRLGDIADKDFGSYAILENGQANGSIDLAPGNYKLEIQLSNKNKLIVPKEKRKEGIFPFKKEYDIPEIAINDTFTSGYALINFTVSKDDMSKDSITFFVISPDLLGIPSQQRTFEDLEQMNKAKEYSEKYQDLLKPVFR